MRKNRDMWALCRAALAGALVGLSVIGFLELWPSPLDVEDSPGSGAVMILAPFPLGLFFCWLAKLPRWPLVSYIAPFAVFAAYFIGITFIERLPTEFLTEPLGTAGIFAAGYLLTTWSCTRKNVLSRWALAATLFIACIAAPMIARSWERSEAADRFATFGVPLIAPVNPQLPPHPRRGMGSPV